MHSEFISVSRALIEELAAHDRPVVAVGTTSVRTLESLYHLGCRAATGLSLDELPQWYPYEAGHPDLTPGVPCRALLRYVDGEGLDPSGLLHEGHNRSRLPLSHDGRNGY